MHSEEPVELAYLPATQLTHTVAADDDVVPAAQFEQDAAPVEAMKVPLLQLVHELAPDAEYLPAEQLVQPKTEVPPVVMEYLPAKHEIPGLFLSSADQGKN